ncbi:MAG: CAP domain-containing protein [Acidimicrobiia bacterium]|nr:CAP domain-containing protein [Acidimicrobiia bacterium]
MRFFLALTVAAVVALPSLPAAADAVDSAVASARGSSLPIRAELEQAAVGSASRQAANLALAHSSLGSLTSICSTVGEIVGAGSSVATVFDLFLKSPDHRPLLLSSTWTAMGTGAVTGSDGKIYISVVFCEEINPSSPPPPPAAPPPSAPQPVAVAPTPTVTAPVVPAYPWFEVVFIRLLGGELDDLWLAVLDGTTAPLVGPAEFVPLAEWSVPSAPALA